MNEFTEENRVTNGKDYSGKISGMSIAAFVLSLTGCSSIIGLILGIIDLTKNDGRKKGLSIAAVVISGVLFLGGIGAAMSGNNTSTEEKTRTEGTKSGYEEWKESKEAKSHKEEAKTAETEPKEAIESSTVKEETVLSNAKEAENKEQSEEKNESESKEESKEENGSENVIIAVGESYDNDGLIINVDGADLNFQVPDDKFGLYKLDDGYHYIKKDFTFENTKDTGDKYVSIYDFDCYADGAACDQEYITSVAGDFMNINLSPGRKVSFTTFYVVPDNAKEIELEYSVKGFFVEKKNC